jgi:hypothetical protein
MVSAITVMPEALGVTIAQYYDAVRFPLLNLVAVRPQFLHVLQCSLQFVFATLGAALEG